MGKVRGRAWQRLGQGGRLKVRIAPEKGANLVDASEKAAGCAVVAAVWRAGGAIGACGLGRVCEAQPLFSTDDRLYVMRPAPSVGPATSVSALGGISRRCAWGRRSRDMVRAG